MFVVLSKTLDLAVSPVAWVLLLIFAAVVAVRRTRLCVALLLLATAILYAFSTALVANALVDATEASARSTQRPGVYDAVVVLSGMVDEATSARTGRVELTAAADRVVAGFELVRDGRAREILVTGGPVHHVAGRPTEPELLGVELQRWGVEPQRIVLETKSRNTHENAVETARVVRERGWRSLLLVTSAGHMKRALGCFHKVGLAPDVLPVDYRGEHDSSPTGWLPRAKFLELSEDALRELTGRAVYRIVGYT